MEPGLVQNDRILVQKWSYWGSKEPERGDVVVFKDPGDWLPPEGAAGGPSGNVQKLLEKVGLYPSGGHLVKRVIGVEGDTIKCCDSNGLISVNGTPLDEPYLSNAGECNGPMIPSCRWTAGPIPEDSLFVMGDHRDMSGDSSAHLCLPRRPTASQATSTSRPTSWSARRSCSSIRVTTSTGSNVPPRSRTWQARRDVRLLLGVQGLDDRAMTARQCSRC